jgi:uncharacterized protein YxjI
MRYVMRQKVLSLAASFTIKDENDREAFYVKGESFRLGNKLSLQDSHGNELVHIDQRRLSWTRTYELWRDGGLLAVVERPRFSFARRFTISLRGSDDLEANGNFLDHEYIFTRGDQAVQFSLGAGSPSPQPAGLKSMRAKIKPPSSRAW